MKETSLKQIKPCQSADEFDERYDLRIRLSERVLCIARHYDRAWAASMHQTYQCHRFTPDSEAVCYKAARLAELLEERTEAEEF